MQDAGKVFSLLVSTFLVLGLVFNIVPRLPRIPGDIYLNKWGLNLYIPWLSSLVISVILTLLFNFFRK